jgi:hypothetical protein
MNYNEKENQKVEAGNAVIWNIRVRVFEQSVLFTRILPGELKYWKLKVVLN